MEMATIRAGKSLFQHAHPSNVVFVYLVTIAFLILGFISIIHHEMWRDELQAWLLARNSASIAELLQNMKYEGHPALWHIALFLISRLTQNPISMQFLHLGIGTATIYIFLRFSPFTKLQKLLFAFSYFPFYEYTIISRNYGIGILLIFLFCTLYDRCRGYLPLAILIAFLANTNAFGFLIAVALAATLVVEKVLTRSRSRFSNNPLSMLLSGLIVIAGFAILLFQVQGASEVGSLNQTSPAPIVEERVPDLILGEINITRLIINFSLILRSYIPIPDISKYQFWNTNLFTSVDILYTRAFALLLAFGLLILSIALFARKPIPLFLYSFGTFTIIYFCYDKSLVQTRHQGHLFILLIASLWIASYYPETRFNFLDRFFPPFLQSIRQYQNYLITGLLCTQVIANTFAVGMDLIYPFSASQEVATFIRKQGLENTFIVGMSDASASAVAALLDREMYYTESDRQGSFIIWKGRQRVRPSAMLNKVSQFLSADQKEVILLLSYELKTGNPNLVITKLFDSQKSIVTNETYYLYLATKSP
jgi:hypothetical protein